MSAEREDGLDATMAPVAPVGLREICVHVCASECTAAHARPLRMNESLPMCSAVFGMSACGKRMVPLRKLVGAKSVGVHDPSFRSHVST